MLIAELVYRFHFNATHLILEIATAPFQDMLDLSDRNNREEFGEQEITGKEKTKRTHVEAYLPDSGTIVCAPGTGQVVAVNRSNDDYKTFEPHTDIHQD